MASPAKPASVRYSRHLGPFESLICICRYYNCNYAAKFILKCGYADAPPYEGQPRGFPSSRRARNESDTLALLFPSLSYTRVMTEFLLKSICILGRQPALGLAELESLYCARHIKPIHGAALLDIEAADINFKRVGGTLKVAKILAVLPFTDWSKLFAYLKENIHKHLKYLPEGQFRLGVSCYGIKVPLRTLNANLLEIKKIIRQTGRSVRIIPNKSAELNSAQVLHNKLTHRGGWELLLIRNGNQTILAQTL